MGWPHTIAEIYRSGAIRFEGDVNVKPRVVNGQRLKNYIAGDPIGMEVNAVHLITLEELIQSQNRNLSEAK